MVIGQPSVFDTWAHLRHPLLSCFFNQVYFVTWKTNNMGLFINDIIHFWDFWDPHPPYVIKYHHLADPTPFMENLYSKDFVRKDANYN